MKISVIVPLYNGENYFFNLMNCIVNQTYKNFELIVVNDGSTDNSLNLLKQLQQEYDFLKVINKPNGGSASARNIGLSLAEGQYICMLDADDTIEKDYLELMYKSIKKYDSDIAICDFDYIKSYQKNSNDNHTLNILIYEKNNLDTLNEYCNKKTYIRTCVLWNKLFKKELFNGLKFVEGKSIDDEYIILHLLYRAKKIIDIKKVLYHYYISNSSSQMKQKYSIKRLDSIDVMEKNILFLKSIHNKKIQYDKLYYNLYSLVIMNEYFIKKTYEKESIVRELKYLKEKKKGISKAFLSRNISFINKGLLLIQYIVPRIFFTIKYYLRPL